jgi:hypothetical protein
MVDGHIVGDDVKRASGRSRKRGRHAGGDFSDVRSGPASHVSGIESIGDNRGRAEGGMIVRMGFDDVLDDL